jgi:hypothetical protein
MNLLIKTANDLYRSLTDKKMTDLSAKNIDSDNKSEKTMKVYLDNCCFNRPFDDQNQISKLSKVINEIRCK